jgi:PAS domain S-box-containing protein
LGILEEASRLARRRFISVVALSSFVLVVVAALSYANFIYTKNNSIDRVIYSELPWLTQKIVAQIEVSLKAPLAVSKDMASDPWVLKWLQDGEKDVPSLTKKLLSSQISHGALTAFLISDKSKKYYNESGLLRVLDIKKDPHDDWYYVFKDFAKNNDYELATDTSQANKDKLTIFINYTIRSNDKSFMGVVGLGLTLKDMSKELKKLKNGRDDIQLWLVDENGDMKVSEDGSSVAISSDKSSRFSLKSIFGASNANAILKNENKVIRIKNNDLTQLVTVRYIKDLKWFIVAKIDEKSVVSGMNNQFLENEAIFSTLILLFALFGVWFYNKSWLHKEHTMLRLTAIFNNSSLGICIINKKGRFIEVNNALQSILHSDIINIKLGYFYDIFQDDKKELVSQYIKDLFDLKIENAGMTLNLIGHDGQITLVNMTLSAVMDYSGNVEFIYAIIEDITERQMLQEKHKRQEDLLIQQSKMAALCEMIDMVAHQWKQPLSALSMSMQEIIFFGDLGEFDETSIRENARRNLDIINNMSNTLDDFRGFFKPNKNKEMFRLKESVQKVYDIMANSFNRHQVKAFIDMDDELICHGVANELQQVLLSLISNAKDALDSRVQTDKVIKVEASKINNSIIIKVKDNADGVKEEFLEKIFEPRFTLKENSGSGVGLYMSRIIVEESFGGKIWAENDNEGAVFTIKIPVEI